MISYRQSDLFKKLKELDQSKIPIGNGIEIFPSTEHGKKTGKITSVETLPDKNLNITLSDESDIMHMNLKDFFGNRDGISFFRARKTDGSILSSESFIGINIYYTPDFSEEEFKYAGKIIKLSDGLVFTDRGKEIKSEKFSFYSSNERTHSIVHFGLPNIILRTMVI